MAYRLACDSTDRSHGIKTIAKETWKFLRKHKLDDAGEDDDDAE
jgi:hypothetical protein